MKMNTNRTDYYHFNAFDQMKAYSDNGETYGYYGYDDAGQRTYKMLLNRSDIYTNRFGNTTLEVEKLAFYPNGFINIDQYGNYSKHYYADAQRIASKIGTGSVLSKNLCDSLKISDTVLIYLDSVIGEKIQNDLKFVTLPETEVEIDYGDYIVCDLQTDTANNYENAVYFYHGSHIASTMMVTDWQGNVSQAVMYAPFGEVISNYNAMSWQNGIVPDYMFSAMELDEESQMYYFNARYMKPPTFISRDVLFEKYFWMSGYAYCANNPVKIVDPTGMEGEVTDLIKADNHNGTNHTEQLTTSLSTITGMNVCTEERDGKTFLKYDKDANGNPVINTDANGNPVGSETARNMLMSLIDSKDVVTILPSYSGSKGERGENQLIGLDFGQIQRYMKGVQGGLNKETMGYGMVFLHEFLHTDVGGGLPDNPKNPGPVVTQMNIIRSELNAQGGNYGQRLSYYYERIGGQYHLPFDKVSHTYINSLMSPPAGTKFITF